LSWWSADNTQPAQLQNEHRTTQAATATGLRELTDGGWLPVAAFDSNSLCKFGVVMRRYQDAFGACGSYALRTRMCQWREKSGARGGNSLSNPKIRRLKQ
jgi:hypothetical protein